MAEKEILDAAKEQSLIDETGYQDALTQINENAADARKKLDMAEMQSKLSMASSMFSNLSQLMNTGSKKMFKIGKAAAISGAVIDSIAAVVKTMSSMPYPINIPLAAAQAAAGAAQVANIKKQKFGQAGSPVSFSGGQPSVNTGNGVGLQQPSQNINIALNGSTFGAGGVRGLIEEINSAIGDGVQLNVG